MVQAAMSAYFIISFLLVESEGYKDIPILTLNLRVYGSITRSALKRYNIFSEKAEMYSMETKPESISMNSSPPIRKIFPLLGQRLLKRFATSCSTWSPPL